MWNVEAQSNDKWSLNAMKGLQKVQLDKMQDTTDFEFIKEYKMQNQIKMI